MSSECLVGMDVGTSSTRVSIYSVDGKLLAEGRAPHQVSHPYTGWAEEDAEDWWNAVCVASNVALNAFPLPP